eukprot:jgi/Botrbrau1/5013/Bobra.0396s0034.1
MDQDVIGRHGRFTNMMKKRILQSKNIPTIVFDEADKVLKTDASASDSVQMINQVRLRIRTCTSYCLQPLLASK